MKYIAPKKKYLTILSALATGWLPWGVQRRTTELVLLDGSDGWIDPFSARRVGRRPASFGLCCGHDLSLKEAEAFVEAGLLERFVREVDGRECLRITESGKRWLADNWIS
ncbi:hypothetical protein FHS78_000644 [Parvibaculum indicum]|uniref:hypothetical protein n=1 Tax=Parvibaculum indicum TaxID=562969 RepID=UPI0014245889|nr:hypothetical protein [Parvibaculum indicum]NIJ40374.1 hypothetical protein [Parvibaculum indicum]